MKKLISVLLAAMLCMSFVGCNDSYQYKIHAQDGFDIGYNTGTNDAYVSTYHWDGDENNMRIAIPESYNGMPITALGGYHGLGVPDAFGIELPETYKNALSAEANLWGWSSVYENIESVETIYLNYNIHISKNIEKNTLSQLNYIYVGEYYDGENYDLKVCVVFRYTFTCDDENQIFYAKDGKLYYKEDNTLVSHIFYYDHEFDD